jgi:guanosine-3',5'-bis(diphosphate) 3'-pyrophosphohydrolase
MTRDLETDGYAQTGLILKALTFAAYKHRHQRRKGVEAVPYINHPIELANLLWNTAGIQDAEVIAAALLHDTVEDTDTTFDELDREFGPTIRSLVAEVTDDKSLPKEVRKQLQIDHAPHLSDRARFIKLADKISNLRDMLIAPPIGWSIERKLAYFQWGKAVIDQIRGAHAELEGLFDEIYEKGLSQLSPGE